MKWFKRIATIVATGAVLLTGYGAVATTPAQAHLSDCPADYFCFWVDGNFEPANAVGALRTDAANLGAFPNGLCRTGNWNDCISSFYNNTSRIVIIYEHADYNNFQGTLAGSMIIYPGDAYDIMPWWTNGNGNSVSSNDQISSIDFI